MNGRALLPMLLPIAVLAAWTALSSSGLAPAYLLPGPGAVTTTRERVVSMYSLSPYPSSLTMVSISLG